MPYADPEKQKQYFAAHYRDNKEKKQARNKKDYAENKEKRLKDSREYDKNNPEKRKVYNKRWRDANPEKAAASVKAWTVANPARVRNKHLKRICWTPEGWEKAYEEQSGVCAICKGLPSNGRGLSADHDHKNKIPRGLLCNECNFMLGKARDNPDILEAGAQYLRKYSDA
jgi:hypothetical protein